MLKLLERPKPFFLFENSLLHVRCLLLPTNAHSFANIHFCDRWMFKRHFCLDGMVATSKEHPVLLELSSFRYDSYFFTFLFFFFFFVEWSVFLFVQMYIFDAMPKGSSRWFDIHQLALWAESLIRQRNYCFQFIIMMLLQ